MTDYDNTNRGSLFKNDKKTQENHPDYKGQINIKGTDYWLNAWLKTSTKGTKFMSLSVSPKEAAKESSKPVKQAPKPTSSGFDDMDDDIPF